MQTVRMLRTRIAAICGATTALQTCLQKSCEGLKGKLKPGPMCTALQKLLTGAHVLHCSSLCLAHLAYQSLALACTSVGRVRL